MPSWLCAPPNREIGAEDSTQKRSSLAASDHRPQARVLTIVDTFSRFSSASEPRFILRGADVVGVFEGPASVVLDLSALEAHRQRFIEVL